MLDILLTIGVLVVLLLAWSILTHSMRHWRDRYDLTPLDWRHRRDDEGEDDIRPKEP